MLGSCADQELGGKIKASYLPPYNRGEADGVRGGRKGLGMEGGEAGVGEAVANKVKQEIHRTVL